MCVPRLFRVQDFGGGRAWRTRYLLGAVVLAVYVVGSFKCIVNQGTACMVAARGAAFFSTSQHGQSSRSGLGPIAQKLAALFALLSLKGFYLPREWRRQSTAIGASLGKNAEPDPNEQQRVVWLVKKSDYFARVSAVTIGQRSKTTGRGAGLCSQVAPKQRDPEPENPTYGIHLNNRPWTPADAYAHHTATSVDFYQPEHRHYHRNPRRHETFLCAE